MQFGADHSRDSGAGLPPYRLLGGCAGSWRAYDGRFVALSRCTKLPQMTERIKMQSGKDRARAEQGDVDPKQIIADWCAKQTQKTALCEEAAK